MTVRIQLYGQVRVKKTVFRPGQTLKPLEFEAHRISRQSANEGGKVVSSTHRLPLPHRKYSWYSFILEASSTQGPQSDRKE